MSINRWLRAMCAVLLFLSSGSSHAQVFEGKLEEKKLTAQEKLQRQASEPLRKAQAIFGLGVMRHRGDRWLEAVGLLEEAARLDPQTPAASRALIPLYLSLAREEDALDCCRKVLLLDPNDSGTAWQLAKLIKSDGRPLDAIPVLVQGSNSNRIADNPELLYSILNDLTDLQEKASNYAAAISSYRRLAEHLIENRLHLIGSETLTAEQHGIATARAYEKIGQCLLQQQKYVEAIAAFRESRDYLEHQADPQLKAKAVRLNWNMAQVCITPQDWTLALSYLDIYLRYRPADVEPYEKKVLVLRKLGRESDVLPALKQHASQVPDALPVQLLFASLLSEDSQSWARAEAVYLALADRFVSPEIYRGLFKLYEKGERMVEALNLIDKVMVVIGSKEEVPADVREGWRERGRALLQVLKQEPTIVNALLPAAVQAVADAKPRKLDTWQLVAALAARGRQWDKAEVLYRHCLSEAPAEQKAAFYGGLHEVLWMQRKYADVISTCKEGLERAGKSDGPAALVFHRCLAMAYSETDKVDEALIEIDCAMELSKETNTVTDCCRKARILARASRYDAAIGECEKSLKSQTQAADIKQVRYTLASIYNFKGDHERSEAQLLKILEEDPNDPAANNDLGYQWADRQFKLDEAERLIRKAIEVDGIHRHDDPDAEAENAAYLDSLGWVLFRKGNLAEARTMLEKAATFPQGAEDPTVSDHLGDVYVKLRMTAKAKEMYRKAIELYEHDKQSKKEGKQEAVKKKLAAIDN